MLQAVFATHDGDGLPTFFGRAEKQLSAPLNKRATRGTGLFG